MKQNKSWLLTSLLLAGLTQAAVLNPIPAGAAKSPKHLLVVTVTKGFRHSSIPTAEKVLGQLADKSDGAFTVDYVRTDADMAAKMTPDALKNYDGVVFANTSGVLPLPDKAAFLDWIKSGHAFIGLHGASETFRGPQGQVDPYIEMLGGEFKEHGPQAQVECLNEDLDHPATRHFGKSHIVKDEIYLIKNFDPNKVHVLLALDKHPNTGEPGFYPLAWCKKYGQGSVFYTSLGHREDLWENQAYQQHVLGGINWALGLEPGEPR